MKINQRVTKKGIEQLASNVEIWDTHLREETKKEFGSDYRDTNPEFLAGLLSGYYLISLIHQNCPADEHEGLITFMSTFVASQIIEAEKKAENEVEFGRFREVEAGSFLEKNEAEEMEKTRNRRNRLVLASVLLLMSLLICFGIYMYMK